MADLYDLEGFLAEQGINYTPYREPETKTPGLFDTPQGEPLSPSQGIVDTELMARIKNLDPAKGLVRSLKTPSSELIAKNEPQPQVNTGMPPSLIPLITGLPMQPQPNETMSQADVSAPALTSPKVKPSAPMNNRSQGMEPIPVIDPDLGITVERARELETPLPGESKEQLELDTTVPEQKEEDTVSSILQSYRDQLVDRQNRAERARMGANIADAFTTFATTATGTPDQSAFFQRLADQADIPVEDLQEELKLRLAEKQAESEEAYKKTDSEESQSARDLIKGVLPEFANRIPNFENMSADELDKAMPFFNLRRQLDAQTEQAELRRLTQERLMQKDEEMQKQKGMEENRRVSTAINNEAQRLGRSDPVIRKVREQNATFDELGPILEASEQGNQAAIAALGTRLARAMGEVGVLTDQDVVRYLGNTSWARQLSSWLKKGAVGQLPDAQLEDLQQMVGMMQDVYTDKVGSQFDQAAAVLMERYPVYLDQTTGERVPMTIDQARALVGHPLYTGSEELRNSRQEQLRKEFGIKPIESGQVRRRTKDGRIAIFDENTKEFIRFEDE